MTLPPGYRPLALLAHGRRLDTWDAWDEDRDCRVVVKVLREDRLHEPDVVAAVLREGRIVTSLAHPHLVRGLDVVEGPRPAIVLETLTGSTLGAVVDDGPLEAGDVAQLGLQLCSVLGYLHRHGWLHLDVKPANVVAQAGRAVLIDLSLAGRPGPGRRGAGTWGYRAPEQDRGDDVGPATDVHGLAVTLAECLTGELPAAPPAWRARWSRARRPALPPTVPAALAACVSAGLAPDPADRPSLAEVREACRGVVPPVLADP